MIAPGQKGKFLPRRQQQTEIYCGLIALGGYWSIGYGATKGSEKVGPNSTNAHH